MPVSAILICLRTNRDLFFVVVVNVVCYAWYESKGGDELSAYVDHCDVTTLCVNDDAVKYHIYIQGRRGRGRCAQVVAFV